MSSFYLPEVVIFRIGEYLSNKELLLYSNINKSFNISFKQVAISKLTSLNYFYYLKYYSDIPIHSLFVLSIPRMFLIGGQEDYRRVDIFNFNTNEFKKACSTGIKRVQQFDCLFHQGRIFVLSGCADTSLGSVEYYDNVMNTWKVATTMPIMIVSFASISLYGKIMTFGGIDHKTFKKTDNIWTYDDNNESCLGTWTLYPISMLQPRSSHAVIYFESKLWIIGGTTNTETSTCDCEVFDFHAMTWRIYPSMNSKRYQCRAMIISNQLYVCGGDLDGYIPSIGTIERFNKTSNNWEYVTQLPFFRLKCCFCSINNWIIVVGGKGNSSWDIYDVVNNHWFSQVDCDKLYNFSPLILDKLSGRNQGMTEGVVLCVL